MTQGSQYASLAEKIGTRFPEAFSDGLTESGIGFWLWDVKNDVLEVSPSLLNLTGYSALELGTREQFLNTLIHSDDLEKVLNTTRHYFAQGGRYETLCRMRHKTGHYVWINTKGRVIREYGTPSYMIGVVHIMDDLTRLKRDMERTEEFAGLGNWSVDVATQKVTWSKGVFRIYERDPATFVPTLEFARSMWAEEEAPMVLSAIEEALKTCGPFEYRMTLSFGKGREKVIKVAGAVESGFAGDPVAYFGTMQDVTAEVTREEKLRQSQRLETIGKLAGGVAHDFNNLLAVVLGNLELLQEGLENESQNKFVDQAIQATLRGADLTHKMLSFARQATLAPTLLDLNAVVQETRNWAGRTLPENIDIETSLLTGLWPIEADRGSTENALLNLILNARDAMPNGGRLTIETANIRIDQDYVTERKEDIPPGRYVMLAVSDTGHGIAKGAQTEIFEPFYTTKEPGTGTGLGLSMVQGFMKQSGGAIQVYSEAGHGTTFKLYFRASSGGTISEVPELPEGEFDPTIAATKSILLVEDEPEVLKVLNLLLTRRGFNVTCARSGDEAKQIFEAAPDFDLVITDIVMPGRLQGPLLSKELREIRPDLPMIFMSGYANEATVHGNGLRPEDTRLMKPVNRSALLSALRKTLG
ncbi:PAS domain-containing protein [Pelagimonas varians]|uniref:histidine kinase n=1 Tax=Pelagimonas varians TaxID=696760 RepID=A0A238KNJ6_9RHOB|nr:PAS domain-containing protein [Pelagimonas varians]PYG28843.1 PAS domain S-box-containing protein [Pelagimonas varians]SMX44414.1 Blue-light-activated protein [Pelagimonas varians]